MAASTTDGRQSYVTLAKRTPKHNSDESTILKNCMCMFLTLLVICLLLISVAQMIKFQFDHNSNKVSHRPTFGTPANEKLQNYYVGKTDKTTKEGATTTVVQKPSSSSTITQQSFTEEHSNLNVKNTDPAPIYTEFSHISSTAKSLTDNLDLNVENTDTPLYTKSKSFSTTAQSSTNNLDIKQDENTYTESLTIGKAETSRAKEQVTAVTNNLHELSSSPSSQANSQLRTTSVGMTSTVENLSTINNDLATDSVFRSGTNNYQRDQEVARSTTLDYATSSMASLYRKEEKLPQQIRCDSLECKQLSGRILSKIDHSTDACDDFYQHACGGVYFNNVETPTHSNQVLETIPEFDLPHFNIPTCFNTFYESCMSFANGQGLEVAAKFLYDLCVTNNTTGDKAADLTKLLADILMTHPQKSAFRLLPLFDVVMDVGHNQAFVPTITLPRYESVLANSEEIGDIYHQHCMDTVLKRSKVAADDADQIHKTYERCIRNQSMYMSNLETAIEVLQIFEHLDTFQKGQEIQKTLLFIELEILNRLGSPPPLPVNRFDDDNNDLYKSIDYLQDKFPQIIWQNLFEQLCGKSAEKYVPVKVVKIQHIEYLVKIFEFYAKHSLEEIKTPLLSMMAHDIYVELVRPDGSVSGRRHRRKYCRRIVANLMPELAAKMFVEKVSDSVSDLAALQTVATDVFSHTIQGIQRIFDEDKYIPSYLDDRIEMMYIIEALKVSCDANQIYLNQKYKLVNTQRFEELIIDPNNFINNLLLLKEATRKQIYMYLGTEPKMVSAHDVWTQLTSPMSTDLFIIPNMKTMVIPLGAIVSAVLPTFLMDKAPKYVQHSTLGYRIAQEMRAYIVSEKKYSERLLRPPPMPSQWTSRSKEAQNKMKYFMIFDDLDRKVRKQAIIDLASIRYTFTGESPAAMIDELPWLNNINVTVQKLFFYSLAQQCCRRHYEEDIYMTKQFFHNPQVRLNTMLRAFTEFRHAFHCNDTHSMTGLIELPNADFEKLLDADTMQKKK